MDKNTALTPQEVADLLKIAKNTVYELIKRGELNSYRVGNKVRVDMKDVEEYKDKSKSKNTVKVQGRHTEDGIPGEYGFTKNKEMPENSGFVICGQDVILDILSRHLENHPEGVRPLRSHEGSYNGLYMLYNGDVEIASAHLWDGDSDSYNIPYVKRMLPGTPAVIIHLAGRMQGFYVAKGNPKKIESWEDLKRSDISIVCREKGSGTRVLLDEHIRLMGLSRHTIKGYEKEGASHLAVASMVARGEADLAVGNEKAALQVKNIDFIPLQKERYDMVIKKEDMNKPVFQEVLSILRSNEYRNELEGIGGYDIADTGKIVGET